MSKAPNSSERIFINLQDSREILYPNLLKPIETISSTSSETNRFTILNLISRGESFGIRSSDYISKDEQIENESFIVLSEYSENQEEDLENSIKAGFEVLLPNFFNVLKRTREPEFPPVLEKMMKDLQDLVTGTKKKYINVQAEEVLKKIQDFLNCCPEIDKEKAYARLESITKKKPENLRKIVEIIQLKDLKKLTFSNLLQKREKFLMKKKEKFFLGFGIEQDYEELKAILNKFVEENNRLALLQSKKRNLITLEAAENKYLTFLDKNLQRKSIGCVDDLNTEESEGSSNVCHSEVNPTEISTMSFNN